MISSFSGFTEGCRVGDVTSEAEVRFKTYRFVFSLVSDLLCMFLVQQFSTQTIFRAWVSFLKQVCTSEIYTCVLLGSGVKCQMLLLRAIYVIFIEINMLYYPTEMPL